MIISIKQTPTTKSNKHPTHEVHTYDNMTHRKFDENSTEKYIIIPRSKTKIHHLFTRHKVK